MILPIILNKYPHLMNVYLSIRQLQSSSKPPKTIRIQSRSLWKAVPSQNSPMKWKRRIKSKHMWGFFIFVVVVFFYLFIFLHSVEIIKVILTLNHGEN